MYSRSTILPRLSVPQKFFFLPTGGTREATIGRVIAITVGVGVDMGVTKEVGGIGEETRADLDQSTLVGTGLRMAPLEDTKWAQGGIPPMALGATLPDLPPWVGLAFTATAHRAAGGPCTPSRTTTGGTGWHQRRAKKGRGKRRAAEKGAREGAEGGTPLTPLPLTITPLQHRRCNGNHTRTSCSLSAFQSFSWNIRETIEYPLQSTISQLVSFS